MNKRLVRRALSEGRGFIWRCKEKDDTHDDLAGIYVPLLWQGEALAGPGEVLISPEVYQRVWEIVKEERTTTKTKHEGTLSAHRIKNVDLK